jgi:hypothetical protein
MLSWRSGLKAVCHWKILTGKSASLLAEAAPVKQALPNNFSQMHTLENLDTKANVS